MTERQPDRDRSPATRKERGRITLYNRWRRWRGHSYTTHGHEPMPLRFYELATYNSERSRGIAHVEEHQERMRALQRDCDAWSEARYA